MDLTLDWRTESAKPVTQTPRSRALALLRRLARRDVITVFVAFAAVIAVQFLAGAYQTERGNFSDEAAHFMNGLLVRDYLRTGLGHSPIQFAEQYYLHYPKIAPMMWPPLFHLVLGVALLPGWAPQAVSLLLIAFATAWTAWRLSRIVEQLTNALTGYVAAALFVTASLIIDMTSVVMLDVVVAAFALEATFWFSRFLASGQRRHALAFGILATCCCLTKGNGLSILLVPPTAIVLTGRYELLKNKAMYLAAAIVLVVAAPIVTYTLSLDTPMGGYVYIRLGAMWGRTVYYAVELWQQFGSLVVMFGAVACIARGWCRRNNSDRSCHVTAAMAALFISAFAFHVVTPHGPFGLRYMALAVAPMLALSVTGVWLVAKWLQPAGWRPAHLALLTMVVLNFALARPAIAYRTPLGYREATNILDDRYSLAGRRVLVVSDEEGEGAMVTEAAARRISPRPTLIRGSKLIAFENWNGGQFRMNISSSAELFQQLKDLHVDFLAVDDSVVLPYSAMVSEVLQSNAEDFEPVLTVNKARHISLYRLRSVTPGRPGKVHAEVGALGRVLTQQ